MIYTPHLQINSPHLQSNDWNNMFGKMFYR